MTQNEIHDGHTVKSYDAEIERLHRMVLQMGALVSQQIVEAVKTLEDENVEKAREVIHRDQDINTLDIEIDDAILHLVARRQPLARDLREILTTGKIVCDLERMGDQARKIARLTVLFYGGDHTPPASQLLRDIPKMAGYVREMSENAVRAFDRKDLALAIRVMEQDIELENEFKSALRRLSTFVMEDARSIGHVTETTLGLRAIERIGGHAKNIAGHVVFLAKGTDVRHADLAEIKEKIQA